MIKRIERHPTAIIAVQKKQNLPPIKLKMRGKQERFACFAFVRELRAVVIGIAFCLVLLCLAPAFKRTELPEGDGKDFFPVADSGGHLELIPVPLKADSAPTENGFAAPVMAWADNISSNFGGRENPLAKGSENHKGLDIAMATGTEIHATKDGEVLLAEDNDNGYGKHVVLMHDDVLTTLYGHCSELLVEAGQKVKQGDIIALVGSTGNSTGPHVHFEVRENGKAVNPIDFLR